MRRSWLLVLLLAACTGNVVGSDESLPDATTAATDAALDTGPTIDPAVARGALWVAAKVPYCQAINHAHDADTACASTCTRPDNADWDPYRSDCSGFVSWAWGLSSTGGGRTTSNFAPFQTDISHAIAGADLLPGDAVNNSEHMMLFEAWVTEGSEATFMEEPGCSSATPYAHEFTAKVTLSGNTVVVQYHGTFTAIRHDLP